MLLGSRTGGCLEGPDMPRRLPRCKECGRAYRPDRYNEDRQRYCTRPECVLERKRRRNRQCYSKRCRGDPEFRETERTRCAAANRRRRAAAKAKAASSSEADPVPDARALFEVVAGVVSQLTDTSDPVQLHASLRDYQARGRRMAIPAGSDSDPPRLGFSGVTGHPLQARTAPLLDTRFSR